MLAARGIEEPSNAAMAGALDEVEYRAGVMGLIQGIVMAAQSMKKS